MNLNKLPLAGNPKQGFFGQGEPKQASSGQEEPKQVPLGGENSNKLLWAGKPLQIKAFFRLL